jgi:hypothetical protein
VPVWDGLEPQGSVCLNVFLPWNEGWKQTQLMLVSKKEDLLGLLEEISFPEASFLPDVGQRRAVVLSILQRMDVWRVDGGRIRARKIYKTKSFLGSDAFKCEFEPFLKSTPKYSSPDH